jgi:hypothetical protein
MVKKTKRRGNSWPIEGHDHHDISRDSIYENARIAAFLDGDRTNLVIESKGMGKTLLMRVKKKMIIDSDSGALFIPARTMELDEPTLRGAFAKEGYSDLQFWMDIWSVSIMLSIVTHIRGLWDDREARRFLEDAIAKFRIDAVFKSSVINDIKTCACVLPSAILARLLAYSENNLFGFLQSSSCVDEISQRQIKSAVCVFIDSFDQAMAVAFKGNINAWKVSQRGLVRSAHSLFTKNQHIKVFCTMRQEAWSGFESEDTQVIRGKALFLKHSESDLRCMFEKSIKMYTGKRSIKDFIGIDNVKNLYCDADEDVFNYILRHSTGTPRSIMQFGKELDQVISSYRGRDEAERSDNLRKAVDVVACDNIYRDYLLGQKTMFLRILISDERIRSLIDLIPSNVLTPEALRAVHREYCGNLQIPEHTSHPFCELYNVGLLGRIEQDPTNGTPIQHFKKAYEFDWKQNELLQENTLYLLHPGLTSHAARRPTFHINRVNVIGPDKPWMRKAGRKGKREKDGVPHVFISHSSVDKPRVRLILDKLIASINLKFPADFWYDEWKIVSGGYIHQEIERGVEESDVVVLFASANSLNSNWVDMEWRTKHSEEIQNSSIKLIVAMIDDTKFSALPAFLSSKLALRVDSEDEASIERLASDICKRAAESLGEEFGIASMSIN